MTSILCKPTKMQHTEFAPIQIATTNIPQIFTFTFTFCSNTGLYGYVAISLCTSELEHNITVIRV